MGSDSNVVKELHIQERKYKKLVLRKWINDLSKKTQWKKNYVKCIDIRDESMTNVLH